MSLIDLTLSLLKLYKPPTVYSSAWVLKIIRSIPTSIPNIIISFILTVILCIVLNLLEIITRSFRYNWNYHLNLSLILIISSSYLFYIHIVVVELIPMILKAIYGKRIEKLSKERSEKLVRMAIKNQIVFVI